MSKEVEVISGRVKQVCDEETKRNLVQESYRSGLSLNQFAKQRGMSPATLCQWRKKYPHNVYTRNTESDELQCLKIENESLKMELFRIKAYLGHKLFELEEVEIA